jgi:ligand-binding sensor domain-containing protein
MKALTLAVALGVVLFADVRGQAATLRILEQHTNTADVRAITSYEGAVWAATGGGLVAYDPRTGREALRITSADGLAGNSLRSLAVYRGALLVGGDFGLSEVRANGLGGDLQVRVLAQWAERYDPAFEILAQERPEVLQMQAGLHALDAMASLPLGRSWRCAARSPWGVLIGAMDGTLHYRPGQKSQSPSTLFLGEPVMALREDGRGFLVATGNRLMRYDAGRMQPLVLRDEAGRTFEIPATALANDEWGEALIGTADGRLFRLVGGEPDLLHDGLEGRITALTKLGKAIFVGTAHAGVFLIDASGTTRSVRKAGEICGNHVTRLVMHRGALVAATFDSGVCAFVEGMWQSLEGLPSEFVLGLASDGNELWVGTSNGLRRFDSGFNPIALSNDRTPALRDMETLATTAIVALGTRQWAVSYLHGVAHVTIMGESISVELFKNRDGIPKHRTGLSVMGRRLVVASETDGVVLFDLSTKRAKRYLDPVHLPEAWVTDVSTDKGQLWVATCQSGVAKIAGEVSTFFRAGDGLPDERVIAVAADASGLAYVATLGGLALIDPSGAVTSFRLSQGLPDPRGSALLKVGRGLWMGTESGLALVSVRP